MRGDAYDWEFHRRVPMPPPVMGLLPGSYPGNGSGWGWNWWGEEPGFAPYHRAGGHRYDQFISGRYDSDFMAGRRNRYGDEYLGRASLGGRQWIPEGRYDYGYRMYAGPRSRYGGDFRGR